MSFLHTGLLYLLPLAAVPLALHLLTLQRLRTVELPTFRFLFDSYVQERRRLRFLEALLAALRTLFVLFLVLMICRPVVRHWDRLWGRGSGQHVVLLLDCSASMNAVTEGLSAIDRAKGVASQISGRLGPEDRLTLVRVAARPEVVFSRFGSDARGIGERIDGLAAGPSRANHFAALSHIFSVQPSDRPSKVYLVTDAQRSGWRELREQGLERIIPSETPIVVVDVGSREPIPNRAVIGNPPRHKRTILGLPVLLAARIVNHSREQAAEVPLRVVIDDKEVERSVLTLPPGASQTRELAHVPTRAGELTCRFEIPPDRFPDDDRFLFTLSVIPQVHVLLVGGKGSGNALDAESIYLRAALRPPEEGSGLARLAPGADFVDSLQVREVIESELTEERLAAASVVILSNCGSLHAKQFAWLRDFVRAGGGLVVLPGDRVNPDLYNQQFFGVRVPGEERFLGVDLGKPVGDPNRPETFDRLAELALSHPILTVFEDPQARYFESVRIRRRFPLTVSVEGGNAFPLARFGDGGAALVEGRFGEGIVLVAAFPASPGWTNLPLKPEFVPLLLRMVSHVERRASVESPSVVLADSPAELSVADDWAQVEGSVSDPAGRTIPLEFERSPTRFVAAFERTTQAGYYSASLAGGPPHSPRTAEASFAVNLVPEESELVPATTDEIREWLPAQQLTFIDASAQAQQLYGSIGDQREMWRPLVVLLLVIIAAEFLLATLGGTGDAQDQRTVWQRLRDLGSGSWVAGEPQPAGTR